MEKHTDNRRPANESKMFHDLRRRNERRSDLAKALADQRRERAEWVTEVMRERRFNQDR